MRQIHNVNEGRFARHPSIVKVLFVGPNPRGKRGGTSGNPVDALDVARNALATDARLAALSDDTLRAIRLHLGRALELRDFQRLEKITSLQEFALRTLVEAGKLKEALS